MSATSGLCNGGGPHLEHQQGRPLYFQSGPFAGRLAPSLFQKMAQETPSELWVGLFVRPPNADGDGYEELACENYSRVPVRVTSYSAQFDANSGEILFTFEQGVKVTHIGLFDAEGRLRFYGFLSGYRSSVHPPTEVRLPAFEMKIRKPPLSFGSGRPHIGGRPAA